MAIVTADKVALFLPLFLIDGLFDVAGAVVPEKTMRAMVSMSMQMLFQLGCGHSGRVNEVGVTPASDKAGRVLERLDGVEG